MTAGPFDRWKNPDGTYNAVAMLSELSGVPAPEVAWTGRRLGELMRAGKTREEAVAIVRAERPSAPWLTRPAYNAAFGNL